MEKNWKILSADESKVYALQQTLQINYELCKILVQRQVDTFEKAKNYFRPTLSLLHDPFRMKDMDKAVERIIRAIDQKKKFSFLEIMM